jgi:hypothetical protein
VAQLREQCEFGELRIREHPLEAAAASSLAVGFWSTRRMLTRPSTVTRFRRYSSERKKNSW